MKSSILGKALDHSMFGPELTGPSPYHGDSYVRGTIRRNTELKIDLMFFWAIRTQSYEEAGCVTR